MPKALKLKELTIQDKIQLRHIEEKIKRINKQLIDLEFKRDVLMEKAAEMRIQ